MIHSRRRKILSKTMYLVSCHLYHTLLTEIAYLLPADRDTQS